MMNQMKTIRTYSELIKLQTFEERFEYLRLDGNVGEDTFGFDRYLNQMFYNSTEWRNLRNFIIARDGGCDLGVSGYGICGKILIHHINPLTKEDILNKTKFLLDPEYLISSSDGTHKAIHYGNSEYLYKFNQPITRTKNDTCPWRH